VASGIFKADTAGLGQCSGMTPSRSRISVVSGAGEPPSEEERMRLRLAVLDAYLRAAKRRNEVMDVIVTRLIEATRVSWSRGSWESQKSERKASSE
jgi:hypothetical protein